MKIKSRQLIEIISSSFLLQEYYRDFESRIKRFGFSSLEAAIETILKYPELKELFVDKGKDISPDEIINDTTHLATVEYVLDKMDAVRSKFAKDEDEGMEAVEDAVEKEPQPTAQDVKVAAQKAEKNAPEVKLTDVPKEKLEYIITQLKDRGLSAKKLRTSLTQVIQDMIKGSGSMAVARQVLDQDAPIMLKIADEIAKLLDGDLSNIKESTRRRNT